MSPGDAGPKPVAALFPSQEVRERIDAWLSRELAAAAERVARGPVTPRLDLKQFQRELAAFDFAAPQALEPLMGWAMAQLEHGAVHMTHPRYFGLFNPAPNFPSQCAERIAGAFNPQLASSGSSPAPVAIEAHTIGAVARRAGLPEGSGGHFTSGGSEANYTALICALTQAEARFAIDGVRAFAGPVALYTSRECHPAWSKIAHQAGIGRAALQSIATDGKGRMSVPALAAAIDADRARGRVPILVCATAGTTGGGMVDPLPECAEIARGNRLWYHVDAAWGGAALSSERLRAKLRGIEAADSLTIDAHKWLATTMGCGMFITRHPHVLSEAFRVATDFMPSQVAALDPYLNSAQWSRRYSGLRLFLSLAAAGWSGYGAHVENAVAVIERVRASLLAQGWTIANDSSLAVLCVVPPARLGSIADIVAAVLTSGRAWVARSSFEGREVIRICATHGQTTLRDADELVDVLTGSG